MKLVCFFPLVDGYGVIVEDDSKTNLERLKKSLSSKKPSIEYGFDFELNLSYIDVNGLLLHLPEEILEKLLNSPRLYLYSKHKESYTADYLGFVELNVIKIIQLDAMYRISVSFLETISTPKKELTSSEKSEEIREEKQ